MDGNTFGTLKLYDKIYRAKVNASKLVENSDGSVIEALSVYSIIEMADFYTLMMSLSDGARIKVGRNSEATCIENVDNDDKSLTFDMTVYSTSRKELLKTVSGKLQDNIDYMTRLKGEIVKATNTCIVSQNIVNSLSEIYKDEKPMTEEEFAEMALC